jgi:hypothetical protein
VGESPSSSRHVEHKNSAEARGETLFGDDDVKTARSHASDT